MTEPTAWPSATNCKHQRRFAACPDCGARWDLNEIDRLRAEVEDNAVQLRNVAALVTTLNEENVLLRSEVTELREALRSVLIDGSNLTGQAWENIWEKAHAILAKTAPPGKDE